MAIRNLEQFVNNIWNWDCLAGCFGSEKQKPTDVDGLIERRGNFLLLEAKSPGVELSQGQRILLDHLAKLPSFTIIVIWGRPGQPEKLRLIYQGEAYDYPKADLDLLRKITKRWYAMANREGQTNARTNQDTGTGTRRAS